MPSSVITNTGVTGDDIFRQSPLRFVRRQYLRFLQGLFWYRPKGDLHWDPDEQLCDIFVRDEYPVNASTLNGRPAISITRAPVNMVSLGADDMVGQNVHHGTKTKSVLVPGTMTLNCCSRSMQESEDLAFWVAEQIWLLRDVLQRSGFFHIGQRMAIGSPSPAGSVVANDGGKEWYVTSATSPFQLQRTGKITPLGQHIVSGISAMLGGYGASTVTPSGLSYARAPVNMPDDVACFDDNGESVRIDEDSVEESRAKPSVQYELTLHGYRVRRERPPKVRGRRLPLQPSCVGESTERGVAAVKVKV